MNQTACPESDSVYQAMNQLAEEMEQDFKSRTCENCEWYNEFNRCTSGVINGVSEDMKDFGCNRFNEKDNK